MYRLQGGEPGTEWVYEGTPTGYVRNLMPVGPALFWAPAFLADRRSSPGSVISSAGTTRSTATVGCSRQPLV